MQHVSPLPRPHENQRMSQGGPVTTGTCLNSPTATVQDDLGPNSLNQQVTIEPVCIDAWRTYQQIRLRSVRHDGPAFGTPLARLAARTAAQWQEECSQPGRFIAESPTGVVGVIAVDHYTSGPYVCSTWVAPEMRGSGVLLLLVAACLDYAANAGFKHLHAGVFVNNAAGRRTFEKLGFMHDGVLRNSGEASGDWLRLTHPL